MRRAICAVAALLAAGLGLAAPVLAADASKALKKLEKKGLAFTEEKFLTTVFLGWTKEALLYLDAGMSPNASDDKGWTVLHHAVRHPDGELVQRLLAAGAEVDARSRKEDTPLCRAAGETVQGVLQTLIAAGADVDAVCSSGRTPLHRAADEGDAEALAILLAAGANFELPLGMSALPPKADMESLTLNVRL